jgi:hypothetical protein
MKAHVTGREHVTMDAETISVSINCNWRDLYETFRRPETFPEWAAGLSNSSLEQDGDDWKARGPEGPIRIKFSDKNEFGVMDHWVDLGGGRVIYVPLRVVENDNRAEVLLTLFRQPEMTDAKFAEDREWVRRDLLALKALAERC